MNQILDTRNTSGSEFEDRSTWNPAEDEQSRLDCDLTDQLIGVSSALKSVLWQVQIVAKTPTTVLILGETGTGKELIAQALHELSNRHRNNLVKLNCAAIPSTLLESELFGHERGAFTGAVQRKVGRFEQAHQGTLFLDEVGDLPLELQPKLLRVLQEQQFERLGGSQTLQVDTRLVAATSRDLGEMMKNRQFRADLFYRLNVFPIRIPALRERREDIPLLVRHFTSRVCMKMQKEILNVPALTMEQLVNYDWPGNVRELQNFIERAVILSQGDVLCAPVEELQNDHSVLNFRSAAPANNLPPSTLKAIEREHILHTLRGTKGVVGGPKGAAVRLGLNRTTLIFRMQKLGISRESVFATC